MTFLLDCRLLRRSVKQPGSVSRNHFNLDDRLGTCLFLADFVVKVPNRGVTIFPPEDETSRDRRLI